MKDSANPKRTLTLIITLATVLFLPAYLINLGLVQLIRDEAIRALVSFEMIQSGDFLTPTISGVPYLKKPPLFNWILAAFFGATGHYSEVVMRLPVIFSIIGFAATIYYFIRKEFGNMTGLISALAFVTYGRIIFYESVHGLIDITFSWLIFYFFMISWRLFLKEKYLRLFLIAYLLAALAFLLKGLPSLYFTAASLLVLFILGKKFKLLFNWRHLTGILIFILIIGSYYWLFFTSNSIPPGQVWEVLTGEVTRRTIVEKGFWKTVVNFITYPFENIYHFLPWSVLVLALLPQGSFREIRRNPFLWYCLLIFVINIIPYWTSPEGYPRYILMLVPLAMTMLIYLYLKHQMEGRKVTGWIDSIFGIAISLTSIAGIAFLLHPATRDLPGIMWVSVMLFLVMSTISYFFWKQKNFRLLWLSIAMLVVRIAFDFSIIPSWKTNHPAVEIKSTAFAVAEKLKGEPLKIYWDPAFNPDPYFQYRYNNEIFTWYLSVKLDRMIEVDKVPDHGIYYLAKPAHLKDKEYTLIRKLEPPLQENVYLVRF